MEKQKVSFKKLMAKIFRTRELAILFLMVLIMAIVSIRTSAFFNLDNFKDILLDISMVSIVAIGQMLVMVTTGIDISVGSILAVSAMAVGSIVRTNPEVSPLIAIILGLLIGVILGSFNGFVVTFMKIPPIITTLGTLSFFRGLFISSAAVPG